MTDVIECVTADGFAVVEDVIDLDSIGKLTGEIESLSENVHGLRNLHERCDAVARLCRDERMLALARAVIGERAFVVRSLFFDKTRRRIGRWRGIRI